MSCAAGKDVYVEKPLTLFVKEGRWMVNAARKHNRVVQCGTQQRSGKHYQHALELMRSGYIGQVVSARMGSYRNIIPDSAILRTVLRQATSTTICGSGPRPSAPTIRIAGCIISVGSGITRAAR